MLNLNICLVDFSEQAFSFHSIYTQVMPRPQLELLYLATALAVRPNRVTVMSDRDKAQQEGQISFVPLPRDPAAYWAGASFDLVVCMDSLAGGSEIRPYLPAGVPLVLWSHLPPKHVAMLPLQHESVRALWSAFVGESFYLMDVYHQHYQLPMQKCHYRWPTIVRTLRKRFTTSLQLAAMREKLMTMAFTAHPANGLGQTLDMFATLKQDTPELRLRVLLKPGFEPELEPEAVHQLLQRCRETPDAEVLNPMPWPSYAEKLLGCHLLCHPLAFQDLGCGEMIDALAAGCLTVACEHPGLKEVGAEPVYWLPPVPTEDYFERYCAKLAEILALFKEKPERMLTLSFRQIARFNAFFTWDVRVWEWESLFFQLTVNS